MNAPPLQTPVTRYLGVDIHKHYLVIAGLTPHLEVVLPPRRIDLDDWPAWAQKNLTRQDAVALEATTNSWDFYDQTAPYAGQVVVAHAGKIALIANSPVKTDPHDALVLARLLAVGLLPTVWVPPQPVRELRGLLAHRLHLIKRRTMVKNRLHSLLHRHNLHLPSGDPFADHNRAWWDTLKISSTERLHLKHDLDSLAQLDRQVGEVDEEVNALATQPPWAESLTFLLQLPGFGCQTAMTVLAAIGDITRFPGARQLVGYAGLGARVHASGDTYRTGGLTKTGRKDLRHGLIEAAWAATATASHWQAEFDRLCQRLPKNKAIVAIARRLLVTVWHVLTKRQADKHTPAERVAVKVMRWAGHLPPAQRHGLTTRETIRVHLERLGVGADLTHFKYGGMPHRVASAEELYAQHPELRPGAPAPKTG